MRYLKQFSQVSFCGFGHHVHAFLNVSGCNDSFVVCGVEKSKLVSPRNIATGRRRQNCPKGNSSQTRPSGCNSWQSVEHDHCLQGNFLAGALGSWNPAPKLIFTIHCYSVLAGPNVYIYIYGSHMLTSHQVVSDGNVHLA